MRSRQLKWLWKRLRELAAMEIPREEMLMKLGAARSRAPTAWRLVDIEMDKESSMFVYTLNRQKLRRIRRREGRYLLRTNLWVGACPLPPTPSRKGRGSGRLPRCGCAPISCWWSVAWWRAARARRR